MRNLLFSLAALLCLCPTWSLAVEYRNDFKLGYRQDEVSFAIAGTSAGTSPNVLSELQWDTETFYLGGDFWLLWPPTAESNRHVNQHKYSRAKSTRTAALRLWGGYGFIFEGKNQDSDFLLDNRQWEFSRSNNAAENGSVWDVQAAIGMEFAHRSDNGVRFSATPILGYSYHAQNFEITDGNQTIATEGVTPPLGPFPGLKSRYETRWHGPLMGLHLLYVMEDIQGRARLSFWGDAIWHVLTQYRADGYWNLRSDFAQNPSFRHLADGQGWQLAGGFLYNTTPRSSWGLEGSYASWKADKNGVDRTFFSDGQVFDTHLNEAQWNAWMIALRYAYRFP
ncbi:hypothetical protein [Geoalkalibacter halelectricus]|uniref:hypothetical protein n=1 Tax=Geoalkalibacter halelectricus TaxID=2847045 RepID=UPI003D23B514